MRNQNEIDEKMMLREKFIAALYDVMYALHVQKFNSIKEEDYCYCDGECSLCQEKARMAWKVFEQKAKVFPREHLSLLRYNNPHWFDEFFCCECGKRVYAGNSSVPELHVLDAKKELAVLRIIEIRNSVKCPCCASVNEPLQYLEALELFHARDQEKRTEMRPVREQDDARNLARARKGKNFHTCKQMHRLARQEEQRNLQISRKMQRKQKRKQLELECEFEPEVVEE